MTPLEISMLLHVYAIAEPIPNPRGIAQYGVLERFIRERLIIENQTCEANYQLLPRGVALVNKLLSTTLPREAFLDDEGRELSSGLIEPIDHV